MKKHSLIWLLGQVRRRFWAILLLIAAQVANALLGVYFALGSRGVIDSAVAGDMRSFAHACVKQALIIAGIILSLTLLRHLRDQLRAVLERARVIQSRLGPGADLEVMMLTISPFFNW